MQGSENLNLQPDSDLAEQIETGPLQEGDDVSERVVDSPDVANEAEFDPTAEGVPGEGGEVGDMTPMELAQTAIELAVDDETRIEMEQQYRESGILPPAVGEEVGTNGLAAETMSSDEKVVSESREANESPWYKRISKEEAWEAGKSVAGAAASVVGLKGLYSVPEYFRERFKLHGIQIGDKTIGRGLAQTGEELLEKTNATPAHKVGEPSRRDMYEQLSDLEAAGDTDSDAYRTLEAQLEVSRPTAVRDAITEVNDRLALTKEGSEKRSEARAEMARILFKNRHAEAEDRAQARREIEQLLEDGMQQKVDGVTAAKDGMRSVLVGGSGAYALAALSSLSTDAAAFVHETRKKADKEGMDANMEHVAHKFAEAVRENWEKLRGIDATGEKSTGRRFVDRVTAAAKFGRVGGIAGGLSLNTDAYADDLEKLAEMSLEKVPGNFTGNIAMLGERLKSVGSSMGSFFVGDAEAGELPVSGDAVVSEGAPQHIGAEVRAVQDIVYERAGPNATPEALLSAWEKMQADGEIPEDVSENAIERVGTFFDIKAEIAAGEPLEHTEEVVVNDTSPEEEVEKKLVTDKGRTVVSRTVAPDSFGPSVSTDEDMPSITESTGEPVLTPEQIENARAMYQNPETPTELRELAKQTLEQAGVGVEVPTFGDVEVETIESADDAQQQSSEVAQEFTEAEEIPTVTDADFERLEIPIGTLERAWGGMKTMIEQATTTAAANSGLYNALHATVLDQAQQQYGMGAGPLEQRDVWRQFFEKVPNELKDHSGVLNAQSFFESRVPPH